MMRLKAEVRDARPADRLRTEGIASLSQPIVLADVEGWSAALSSFYGASYPHDGQLLVQKALIARQGDGGTERIMNWLVLLPFVALASTGCNAVTPITLSTISSQPQNASNIIDRRLASFSFELSFLPTFAGNKSHPNLLTKKLMKRLEERTGLGPDVRPGGITVDSSVFSPEAPALVLDQSAVSPGFMLRGDHPSFTCFSPGASIKLPCDHLSSS
jgi:hypothetical protein